MAKLEELQVDTVIRGILPNSLVTVVGSKWFGSDILELTYKTAEGQVGNELVMRDDAEARLEVVERGRPWSFDGDGRTFRLVSEAERIHLAHLFDPLLAVHTSSIMPLPHQITAVYEEMLPRQPLRFLLADDPGAGKTIMAGLFIKELKARGDLQRCLVVCPGSLAEQWQDELYQKFGLKFEILTNDKLESAATGNWFMENNLAIARLDKLSRDEYLQRKLAAPDCGYDLIVCDEAHKMSATFFSGEVKKTKRYRLGELLSGLTRHFLLMSATPHNGKDADFQLFMALLDADRFEGRFRDGVHAVDVSDLMRRMVKENLLKFDATPLFPERIATTVPYDLSDGENELYQEVTAYVREEFNRLEALNNDGRAGTVGFALTILQRRLASSPEAIYQSLRRRSERLEKLLPEFERLSKAAPTNSRTLYTPLTEEELDDLEDAPDEELEAAEEMIIDQATAARSMAELKIEITRLKELAALANKVRNSGKDRKLMELLELLAAIFSPNGRQIEGFVPSRHQKLVIFTEHRDTLNYLETKIATALGRPEAVITIHGGVGREERLKRQEAFRYDPEVKVLLATDAAGEGINLQSAHLMINYDLPWNPNRLEQRFGRIHRIGQKEICRLWNLVAHKTREGAVYEKLLAKLEEARQALGGQVFDVLGKLRFEGESLRDLLINAIRGNDPQENPSVNKLESSLDIRHFKDLLNDQALAREIMDSARVYEIREDMERAEARRLQPHYIESFFLEAFKELGGSARQKESKRYEVKHVPALLRNRPGSGPILPRYSRITFEKELAEMKDQVDAAFVCPGHPLLESVIDLTLERHRDLMRQGAVLVDERDYGQEPRVLFYIEHSIQDAGTVKSGERRKISKKVLYVEIDGLGQARHLDYAPYLDYRPLKDDEPEVNAILARPECSWIDGELEKKALDYAVSQVVPSHLAEVKGRKLALIDKTEAAVKDRLTKEIAYWDQRAVDLKDQEAAGKPNARLNSDEARKRADALEGRLHRRLEELKLERLISPLPPVVLGGLLVVPIGLIQAMTGQAVDAETWHKVRDAQAAAARAREIVISQELALGFEPEDVEFQKRGWDIESKVPHSGKLRFIEVKGRVSGAETITATRNEILTALNKPDDYILAMVEFLEGDDHRLHYLRKPFGAKPDFGATSVNYNFAELLARSEKPH